MSIQIRRCLVHFNSANHLIRHFYLPCNVERLMRAIFEMDRTPGPLFHVWPTARRGTECRYIRSYQRTRTKFRNLLRQFEAWQSSHERGGTFQGLVATMYYVILRELRKHMFFLDNFVIILPLFHVIKQEAVSQTYCRYFHVVKHYIVVFMDEYRPTRFVGGPHVFRVED